MPAKLIALICLAVLTGCAGGPEVQKFSRSEIERPYTLPDGVAAWHILTMAGKIEDNVTNITVPPIPIAALWTSSLSKNFDLLWLPIPLGIKYQLHQDEFSRIGLRFVVGMSYERTEGFKLFPQLAGHYRYRLRKVALEFDPSFLPEIAFKDNGNLRWYGELKMGPLFQLDPHFWIKPLVRLSHSKGLLFIGTALAKTGLSNINYTVISPGLELGYSLSQQWETSGGYAFYKGDNGLSAHVGHVFFSHYW